MDELQYSVDRFGHLLGEREQGYAFILGDVYEADGLYGLQLREHPEYMLPENETQRLSEIIGLPSRKHEFVSRLQREGIRISSGF